jgi:hypothetical protein
MGIMNGRGLKLNSNKSWRLSGQKQGASALTVAIFQLADLNAHL